MCEFCNSLPELYNIHDCKKNHLYNNLSLVVRNMQYYYYVYPAIVLSVAVIFTRYIMHRRNSVSIRLFGEALKNENSGHFAEAVIDYQNALDEVRKNRFHSNLESKIVEKLKVLNTVIDYTNNSQFTRSAG